MNETSGPMIDYSGNANTGTLHSVVRTGSAYRFNGSSSYVSVPSSASLNPGTLNFRILVAIKINSIPQPGHDYDAIRKGLSGAVGGDYKVEVVETGQALCSLEGTTGKRILQGGPALSTGVFHTIECRKSASQVTLLVDGAVVSQANVQIGSVSNTSDLSIGAKPGDDFTNGSINRATLIPG